MVRLHFLPDRTLIMPPERGWGALLVILGRWALIPGQLLLRDAHVGVCTQTFLLLSVSRQIS